MFRSYLKSFQIGSNYRNSSGTILLLVLWFVLILSVLAISLGREVAVDLALTKYAIGSLKADGLASSGIMFAMNQIRKFSENNAGSSIDTPYQCPLKDGYFEIGTFVDDLDETPGSGQNFRHGFQDEERKINLNAISTDDLGVLSELISLLGFREDVAKTAAASIMDWQDQDVTPADDPATHCKNRPFDQVEELLLVKGVSEQLFSKLKNFVTVFPKKGGILKVNFNTASEVVLSALTRAKTGARTNTGLEDAHSLTRKIIAYRNGPDGQEATSDDRPLEMEKLGLNAKEQVIFLSLVQNRTKTSRYFRVRVKGVDKTSGTSVSVEAVIDGEDLSIVSYRKL